MRHAPRDIRGAAVRGFLATVALGVGVIAPQTACAQVPGEVNGRVVARADGSAVVGAQIAGTDGETLAHTDALGTFTIRGLAPEAITLRIHAIGFRPAQLPVTVENGRSVAVSVTLDSLPVHLPAVAVEAHADTTGSSTTTITRSAIEASGLRDLAAVLDQQDGLVVSRQGGPGGPAVLSVRGSSANEVLVLVDGVPLNSTLTGEADLSQIPLTQVERVTIIRGAQSARYGPGALAGVVLVDTRRSIGPTLSAQAIAGAWGDREGTIFAGAVDPGVLSGNVTADRRTLDGDFPYAVPAARGGGTAIRQNDAAEQSSASATVASAGAPMDLSAHGSLVEGDRGVPGSVDAPSITAEEGDSRLAGGVSAHDAHGLIRWNADLDAEGDRTTYRDPSPPIGPAFADTIHATSIVGTADATLPTRIVNVTLGTEIRAIHIAATELSDSAPSWEHDEGVWGELHTSRAVGDGVTLTGEVVTRADWDPFVRGAAISPHASIVASRGPFALSLSGGQSFAPPTLADQFFHEGVLVQPNPNLQPERDRDELEVRLAVHDAGWDAARFTGDLSVYQADVTGMILWFPDYRFVWSPDNINVHRRGIDADAELAFPTLHSALHGSLSDVAVDYAGPVLSGQIPYRPRVTATTGASTTQGRLHAELTTRYIGSRRTVPGASINSLSPYWITDAHLTLRLLGGHWPLDAIGGIDDCFDHRAALLVDYPYPGRTWTLGLRFATHS